MYYYAYSYMYHKHIKTLSIQQRNAIKPTSRKMGLEVGEGIRCMRQRTFFWFSRKERRAWRWDAFSCSSSIVVVVVMVVEYGLV